MKKKLIAEMLLKLILEHKENCDKHDCEINIYLFKEIFEDLAGREATSEELKIFL